MKQFKITITELNENSFEAVIEKRSISQEAVLRGLAEIFRREPKIRDVFTMAAVFSLAQDSDNGFIVIDQSKGRTN